MSPFKTFFKVKHLEEVLAFKTDFPKMETENIHLIDAPGRVLAADIISNGDLPGFDRSTMDGYAVKASSTFGASEASPAFLKIKGSIAMGEEPDLFIDSGEAAEISTGGMLPKGADSVVMVEHTSIVDDTAIELYKNVAPGTHIIKKGEDFKVGTTVLSAGRRLKPQEIGLLAAFGYEIIPVYKKPVIGLISTGDEIVSVNENPGPAEVRDINTYSLAGFIRQTGGIPQSFGISGDRFEALEEICKKALQLTDMVILSGGSSVGKRDFTIEVLSSLPDSELLVHGISISPGKPTILAKVQKKALWGLPGHVASSMIIFHMVVRPFIEHMGGMSLQNIKRPPLKAHLTRNISSAQGRTDCVRVRLFSQKNQLYAEPVLGKSGLINTMVKADGIVLVEINSEGIEQGTEVQVFLF